MHERIREKGLSRQSVLSEGIIYGSETFVRKLLEKYGQFLPYYQNRKSYLHEDLFHSLRKISPSSE